MASPFDKFRKKQKVMLAVLGVLCMFGFIVGPMILDMSGGTTGGQGDAVVRIFDETLNEQDLNNLLRERQIASGFVSFLRGDRAAVFGQVTPQSSVIVEALAQEADSLGIVISDDAINKFIDDSNFLQHTRQEINNELSNANWDPEIVFRALRRELMCLQARMMYLPGPDAAVVSPARLWDYYQRLHRRAKIDALPIDANDFLDKVTEPSEDELVALFNEFKNFPADPNSPDPGFAQLATATVEYVRADYDKFFDAAKSEITEEQLKEYYENHKATQYPYTGFVLDEDVIVAPTASGDPVPGQDDATTDEAANDGAADDGAANADGGDGQTTDGATSGDGNSDTNSGDAGSGDGGSGDDGNIEATYPVSLVDRQQDNQGDGTQDDTNPGSGDANQGDANQGDANQGDANQGDAGQDTAAQDTNPANTIQPGAVQELDNRSVPQIAEELRTPTDILGGPDPEFDPFWKVRDRILDKLANEKASERIEAGMAAVRAPLEAFRSELIAYQNTNGAGDDPNNAPRRQQVQEQVAAAAAEHGLEFVLDAAQRVNPYEFGEIEDLQDVSSLAGQSFRSLMESIFSPTLSIYELIDGTDADNNSFLAWKTAETKAFQPTKMEEVREQVVNAWKLREAKKIAKAEAEQIAEKVEAGQSLDEFVSGDNKVLHPPPFTWYDPSVITPQMAAQFGINFPAYSITEVDDLERVSNEFMKATFELEEGDTGVAPNMPETIYYVVTVNRYDYQTGLGGTAEEDARRDFLLTDPDRLADLYALDYSNLQGRMFTHLQEEYIEWLVPAQ